VLLLLPAVAAAQGPSPRPGGGAVIALAALPPTVMPALLSAPDSSAIGCLIWSGLVTLDRRLEPQPELARAWSWSPDGLRLTLSLEPGVRWHDGQPLTAADVKFSIETAARRGGRALARLDGVDAPDGGTVIVRLSRSYAPLLTALTCVEVPVLPRHAYGGGDAGRPVAAPVGSGPFRWERQSDAHLELVRNRDYFKPGLPYLDRIAVRGIPEAGAWLRALEAGEVDHVPAGLLAPDALAALRINTEVRLHEGAGLPRTALLAFNTRGPPADDRRVRHALAMGVNRQRLIEDAWLGFGSVARTPLHPALRWAQNPSLDYTRRFPFNPAGARALLAQAGHPPREAPPRLGLRLLYPTDVSALSRAAALIRDTWASLGLDPTLEAADSAGAFEQARAGGGWDALLILSPPAADPDVLAAAVYLSRSAGGAGLSGYANATMDDVLAQGTDRVARNERRKYYTHAQSLIADDLPVLPLIDLAQVDAARDGLRGFQPSGTPWAAWDRIWRAAEAPARR
jgi:peptide/nickel transport system substrate-binding protein